MAAPDDASTIDRITVAAVIPAYFEAQHIADDNLGNFAPGLALLSARHETQYSRLFRS